MQDYNVHLERDIDELGKLLRSLPKELQGEAKREVLEAAAVPLVEAARALAPESRAPHHRYSTAKLSAKLKAPPGMGNKVSTYHPGNLRKSIRVLKHGKFRRTTNVFVGPKVASGKAKNYGLNENTVDGYYAGMVEGGTRHQRAQPYMRPAFDATKGQVFNLARRGFGQRIDAWRMKKAR